MVNSTQCGQARTQPVSQVPRAAKVTAGAHGTEDTGKATVSGDEHLLLLWLAAEEHGTVWERAYPGTADQLRYLRAALQPPLRCCPIAEDAILLMSELGGNAVKHSRSREASGTFTRPDPGCSRAVRARRDRGRRQRLERRHPGVGQKGLRFGPPAQAFGGLRRIRERIETRGLVPIAVPRCRRHAPRPGPGGRVSGMRHVAGVGPSRRCSGCSRVIREHPGATGLTRRQAQRPC